MGNALKAVGAWLLAMVGSILALFGFDVLFRQLLGAHSPNLWLGLGVALLVFLVVFWGIFRALLKWFFGDAPAEWPVLLLAAVSAGLFVIGLPLYVTAHKHSDGPPIRSQVAIPGRIDLVFVSAGPHRESPPVEVGVQPADLAAWDVHYSVAVPARNGTGLEFLVLGTESRSEALRALHSGRRVDPSGGGTPWRPGAQHAVVVDVDRASIGVPSTDNRLLAAAGSLGAPTFALLEPGAPGHVSAWADWTKDRRGDAASLAELEGPTLLDAGLRLVAESRSTLADRQLAYAYRPMLLFDERELYNWPVDVGSAFADGAVSMCRHGVLHDECDEVKSGADLDQSFAYLKFDPVRFGPADREESPQAIGSAYYYHVSHRPSHPGIQYIDYWWYLPYNPSLTGWMCSPGFSVIDFDCFDHESDWEGVTVEVATVGEAPPAVYYAQHTHVVRQTWSELKQHWKGLGQDSMVEAEGAHHPLVFVARASHASYPYPCDAVYCHETNSPLPEGRYRGESAWTGDEDEVCAGACLKALPVTRYGRPASWNAFSGPWGTQTCIVHGTFCDRGEAPHSPAFQWRYEHPGAVR